MSQISTDAFNVLPNVVKGPSAATWWWKQEIFSHIIWEFKVFFVSFFVGPLFHLFERIEIGSINQEHVSHVSTYFRNQYFIGCFITQMIWLFNVQLSTCSAYWATASSFNQPTLQCARESGYPEPEPSRGLSQQSKTQRWCRHQQLKSQNFVRLKSPSLLVQYDSIGLHWRRKYHEVFWHGSRQRFVHLRTLVRRSCRSLDLWRESSLLLPVPYPPCHIRCCFCILCSVRQPSLPNMTLKCKKFSMLDCTPWGKNAVSGVLFICSGSCWPEKVLARGAMYFHT